MSGSTHAPQAGGESKTDPFEWPEEASDDGPSPDALDELIDAFVELYRGNKQRGAQWYLSMGVTVGGSELSAVMGLNPYSTFFDVVNSKIQALNGINTWTGGGEACWWGVLFEDIIAAYVETDLGSDIKGDEICVQVVAGHRNSPDGYIKARIYLGEDGRWHVWTTDLSPDIPTITIIFILEFKCPLTRKPKGNIPAYNMPQVQSGLAVSPIAHRGLFVDAVFRKCSLFDMGDTPDYDIAYHRRDKETWSLPVAWGLVGVYAPTMAAPLHVRLGWRGPEWQPGDPLSEEKDSDAAQAAWAIHASYLGVRSKAGSEATAELVDFGDMEERPFNRTMSLINQKRFPVTRVPPCFADGRGHPLHTGSEIAAAIAALRRLAPTHFWLVGVIPWKLFEVNCGIL